MMFKLIQLFAAFHQRCCCWGLQLDFIVVVVYSLMSKVLLLTVLHKLIICCSLRLDIKGFAVIDSLLLPLTAWRHRCCWNCWQLDFEGNVVDDSLLSKVLLLTAWHNRSSWGCQHNIIGSVDVEGFTSAWLKRCCCCLQTDNIKQINIISKINSTPLTSEFPLTSEVFVVVDSLT